MSTPSAAPLRGIVPPIITPFTTAGDVDTDVLAKIAERQVAAGVDGIFALGSSGEVAYLTNAQRDLVVRTVVAAVRGRVPVIAGAIELTAHRVAEEARRLAGLGIDGLVATAPLYARNDPGEIADHFRTIAAATPLPLYAYDVPVRVHVKLSPEFLVGLGTDGVIAGVKDSSGDDVSFRRLIALNKAAGHPLQLFTGHEVVVDSMAFMGADGAVPGLANVDPAGYVRLWELAKNGDLAGARAEQERLNALFEIVFQPAGRSGDASGIGAFKTAMAAAGIIPSPAMAFPVGMLDAATQEAVAAVARSYGLKA